MPETVRRRGGCAGDFRAATLSTDGATLYVAGDFLRIGTTIRKGLAAIDVTSGSLKSWDPQADDSRSPGFPSFYGLAVAHAGNPSTDVIYVGGYFTKIKGSLVDPYFAALNSTTGTILPNWHAQADAPVTRIVVVGDTVYAAGNFSNIGGEARNKLAALRAWPDPVSALALSWNPSPNDYVRELTIADEHMLVGGGFTEIGGALRNRVAQLPLSPFGTQPTDWSVDANSYVVSIVASSGMVYLGGSFTQVNGQQRYGLARVTLSERIFRNGFDGAGP